MNIRTRSRRRARRDGRLEYQTWNGAGERYPDGVPDKVAAYLERELALIAKMKFAPYFLTVFDIVRFARNRGILCQGRGSAANSAVCYCLGITSVDPDRSQPCSSVLSARRVASRPISMSISSMSAARR